MLTPRQVLTPDSLAMLKSIDHLGSFAAAARSMGLVPSATATSPTPGDATVHAIVSAASQPLTSAAPLSDVGTYDVSRPPRMAALPTPAPMMVVDDGRDTKTVCWPLAAVTR